MKEGPFPFKEKKGASQHGSQLPGDSWIKEAASSATGLHQDGAGRGEDALKFMTRAPRERPAHPTPRWNGK